MGTWKWDRVLEQMATSMNDGNGSTALTDLTHEKVDHVFDQIDSDGSGEIDADELDEALERMGFKLTRMDIVTMIAVVDENSDGVVDREEFHTLVSMATLRATHKQESKKKRGTIAKFRNSIDPKSCDCTDDLVSSSSMKSQGKKCKEGKGQDNSSGIPQCLPCTYQDTFPPGKGDDRAIIVTEAKHPFAVVGVDEPWEENVDTNHLRL